MTSDLVLFRNRSEMRKLKHLFIITAVLLINLPLIASSDDRVESVYAEEAPQIDGVLDDGIWSKVQT